MDSTTGDMYYHHKVTGATSWTHPGEVAVAEEAEAEKGAETGSSNPDDDWKEITADGILDLGLTLTVPSTVPPVHHTLNGAFLTWA